MKLANHYLFGTLTYIDKEMPNPSVSTAELNY